MRRLNVLLLLAASTFSGSVLAEPAQSVSASAGAASVNTFSDAYRGNHETLPSLSLRYTRELTGRWSGTGLYFYSLGGTFSGYSLGASFDSQPVRTQGGTITNSGAHEVSTVPKWLFRATLTAGLWHYLDTLTKANPRVGEDKEAPVQADLYGVALAGTVQRFLSESSALSFEVMNMSTVASDFSVNALAIGFGYNFYY